MATVWYFWHGFVHRGTTFMYLQYSRPPPPLFITFYQMFRRCRTPSARPSLLMFRIDRPTARISSSRVLYRSLPLVLSLWQRDYNHKDSYRVSTKDFPESPIAMAQEVHDSSTCLTPCIVMKNDGVLYHQESSFYPESMRLRSFRQSEWTIARDPVQHKRLTYPCYRAVNREHQQKWSRWWCTTPFKHLAKCDK